MPSRRYFAAKTGTESKFDFQLIQAIYRPDEAAFDTLMSSVKAIDAPIGTGRSKWNPLMFAIHKKRTSMVSKLLQMGANPNCIDHSTKKTGFHTACTNGYGLIARLLLASGKIDDINHSANEEGETPLIAAVKKSRKYCVELLLNHRLHGQICDINARLKTNQQSAIFIACDKGDIGIAKLLINYKYMKCDINTMDSKGYTPLMKAVGKRHTEMVQLLTSDDEKENSVGMADIHLVNNWKQCATMIAVRTNNFKITKHLLTVNKDVGILYRKDWKNRTILDLCIKYHIDKKITEYVKMLLHVDIHCAVKEINKSENHENVPYLPSGIVQYICNMTY